MGCLSTYAANALLDMTLRGESFTSPATVYLGWFVSPPSADGTGTEVSGGGYTRQAVTFAAPVNGTAETDATVTFTPLHTTNDQMLAGWGIWDAASGGNLLAFGRTPAATIPAGQPLTLAAGGIDVASNDAHMTDDLANDWLDHLLRATTFTPPSDIYAGLYTATPTAAGDDGTEVSGGGYARQVATWVAADQATSVLATEISWTPLQEDDPQDVLGVALHDAVSAGSVLLFADYAAVVEVNAGDTVTHPASSLAFRVT